MNKILFLLALIAMMLSACNSLNLKNLRNNNDMTQDQRIELSAKTQLKNIADKIHVNVTANNGIVLVSGETPDVKLRDQVLNTVRAIANIKLVHNHLHIAQLSSEQARAVDTAITQKVTTAVRKIRHLDGFDPSSIKVVTDNKTVYLMGLLHRHEARVVTEMARRTDDVKKIVMLFELFPDTAPAK